MGPKAVIMKADSCKMNYHYGRSPLSHITNLELLNIREPERAAVEVWFLLLIEAET